MPCRAMRYQIADIVEAEVFGITGTTENGSVNEAVAKTRVASCRFGQETFLN
jgi:hypothetical protein